MSGRDLGARGERAAAGWLRGRGMQILATNWRCRGGEIDIVALDGDTLVVVEVKTRSSTRFGSPAEAVAGRKLARLRALAGAYLTTQPGHHRRVRIDVVAVLCDPDDGLRLRHLPGVTS